MTFLITFFALVIERFFHWGHLRHWRWYATYQSVLNLRLGAKSTYFLLVLAILPWVLAVACLNYLLQGWLFGILQFAFGLAVLLYCLGPDNLWAQIFSAIHEINKEDPQLAVERVHTTFGTPITSERQSFHQAFTGAIFNASYHRIFAVVFWFVVLGPAGAVLYRLMTLSAKESPLGISQVALQWQAYLDWIPIRIFTLLFMFVSHFSGVWAQWKRYAKQGVVVNEEMLEVCGFSALELSGRTLPEDGSVEREAVFLLDRVFILTLVVLAIVALVFKV